MAKKKVAEKELPSEMVASGKSEKSRPIESLREWVGLISAGAGIFAALLYLAGRSFANGYFSAMNIPNFQVGFSLWEYAEVGWIPLLFYPSTMLILTGLVTALFFQIADQLKKKQKKPQWRFSNFSRDAQKALLMSFFSLLILLLTIFAIYSLKFIRYWGQASGQLYILKEAAQVELTSADPMGVDDNDLVPILASGKEYYIYKGFHLLTVNNGKYYLFREIDPVTCKPVKVYVIETQESIQVSLFPAVSMENRCDEEMFQVPTLIPAPTSTP